MKYLFLIFIVFAFYFAGAQSAKEVPYTLDDRDRLIKVEAKMEALEAKMEALEIKMDSLETKMDVKFEAVHDRIDAIFWMMGLMATLMIFILGYMIWDRRTAMKPVLEKATSTEDKTNSLINAMRDYARSHPDLAEILKSHGLL